VTVVLLHAFPYDEAMWAPQFQALTDYDVVAPRLYGRGPRFEEWAAVLLGEFDGPLTLVGASMGGYGPFVIAVGDRDELLAVDEAREIAALAPDGRVEVFPGAGHLPSIEQPEEFNDVLLAFLRRPEPRPVTA
jgi:pimeloyl-ACP methyl ester carboxylesterase